MGYRLNSSAMSISPDAGHAPWLMSRIGRRPCRWCTAWGTAEGRGRRTVCAFALHGQVQRAARHRHVVGAVLEALDPRVVPAVRRSAGRSTCFERRPVELVVMAQSRPLTSRSAARRVRCPCASRAGGFVAVLVVHAGRRMVGVDVPSSATGLRPHPTADGSGGRALSSTLIMTEDDVHRQEGDQRPAARIGGRPHPLTAQGNRCVPASSARAELPPSRWSLSHSLDVPRTGARSTEGHKPALERSRRKRSSRAVRCRNVPTLPAGPTAPVVVPRVIPGFRPEPATRRPEHLRLAPEVRLPASGVPGLELGSCRHATLWVPPARRRWEPSDTCWFSPSPDRDHSVPVWVSHGSTTLRGRWWRRHPPRPTVICRTSSSTLRSRS